MYIQKWGVNKHILIGKCKILCLYLICMILLEKQLMQINISGLNSILNKIFFGMLKHMFLLKVPQPLH